MRKTFKTLRAFLGIYIIFALVGCMLGGGAPVIRTLSLTDVPFEKAYENALAAMRELGRVESTEKERGSINGATRDGVNLDIEIKKTNGQAEQVTVKGWLPGGKFAIGTMDQPDKFIETYRNISQSR